MPDSHHRKPPADPRYDAEVDDGVYTQHGMIADLFTEGPAPAPVHEFIDTEAATRVSNGRQIFGGVGVPGYADFPPPPVQDWPAAPQGAYPDPAYGGYYGQPIEEPVPTAVGEVVDPQQGMPVPEVYALSVPSQAKVRVDDTGYPPGAEFSWIRENAAEHVASPSPDLVLLSNADGYAAAQFRALRYRLEQEPNVQVVAVASPREGDGRSVTAANLALALAEGGRIRVLLVDAALRNPAQHKLFGIRGDLGLTSVLAARQNDPSLPIDVIRISTSLSLIPAGPPVQSAYAALSSEPAAVFMAQIRKEYRFIIVDSSPVFGTAETLAWHGMIDKYVLLARAGKSTTEDLSHACDRLQREKILGVCFVGAALRRS
jgi:Mrp family chromosome partitioning ATPase